MYSTLPRPLTDTLEISCAEMVSPCSTRGFPETHLDLEVGVQQELEVEALLSLVANCDDGLQAVLAQCDAVNETKVQRPRLAVLVTEAISV